MLKSPAHQLLNFMEKFNSEIKEAAVVCLKKQIPFCVYSLPGEDSKVVFFANPSGKIPGADRRFFIGKWLSTSEAFIFIYDEWSEREVIENGDKVRNKSKSSLPLSLGSSISKEEYIERLTMLVEEIRHKDVQKVVFSRVKEVRSDRSPEDCVNIAEKVFRTYPNAFRSFYFTQETGVWLGATPELILNYDKTDGKVETFAIAGTRNISCGDEPWDNKNIEEQKIVARYIAEKLQKSGYVINGEETFNIKAGDIQHIATRIQASPKVHMSDNYGYRLLDSLNPTPALCGFPKEEAMEIISRYENYERDCYGGVIGVENSRRLVSYVNLRCAEMSETDTRLYAGGGILRDSDVEQEWEETERKLQTIGNFL